MTTNISIGIPFGELNVRRTTNLTQLSDVVTNNDNIGIGTGAIVGTTATKIVAIGVNAGNDGADVKEESVMIGYEAGAFGCGESTIAIGRSAGHGVNAKDADDSVIIGPRACNGLSGTYGDDCVVIGSDAGGGGTGTSSIAIGDTASAKGSSTIAIGKKAGFGATSTTNSVIIGDLAASDTGSYSIKAVAIGTQAGQDAMGEQSTAVGHRAYAPGQYATALGTSTVATELGSVALGVGAQATASNSLAALDFSQAGGQNNVCIGKSAQSSNDNCIVLNASGSTLASTGTDAFYVKPIKVEATVNLENHVNLALSSTGFTQILMYSPSTGEIRAVTQPTIP